MQLDTEEVNATRYRRSLCH